MLSRSTQFPYSIFFEALKPGNAYIRVSVAHRISPISYPFCTFPLFPLSFLIHLFPLPFIHLSPTRLVLSSFAPDSHSLSVQTAVEGGCWLCGSAERSGVLLSDLIKCTAVRQVSTLLLLLPHFIPLCVSVCLFLLFTLPPSCFSSSLLDRTLGSWVTEKETDSDGF